MKNISGFDTMVRHHNAMWNIIDVKVEKVSSIKANVGVERKVFFRVASVLEGVVKGLR